MTGASLDLPGGTASGGAARAFVTARLADWNVTDPRGDILILVSELVNNAVQHGGGPPTLKVELLGDRLRVEVHDASTRLPAPRQPDSHGGLGLHLVTRLCGNWGVDSHDAGKVVWCEYLTTPA
jgi:anti-sigma regulatory factor (Ser/Thr protein kinase)